MNYLTIDQIMDRLSRICRKRNCNLRTRLDFESGPRKWYVSLSGVFPASISNGASVSSFTESCNSGSTPEEALRNVWQAVLNLEENEEVAIMRCNCSPETNIPGTEPQVWVRWSSELDDWVDVLVPRLSPDRLRTYKEQFSLDRDF